MKMNNYDKLVIRNGCRPAWLSDRIPKNIEKWLKPYFDEIFYECCCNHDDCYYFGGNLDQFNKCNKRFYKCMKRAIKKKSHWYSRYWFYYKAWQYYKLVQKWGLPSFYFDSGSGLRRLLPSELSEKDPKIRKQGIATIWINNRWWTREEAIKLGLLKVYK